MWFNSLHGNYTIKLHNLIAFPYFNKSRILDWVYSPSQVWAPSIFSSGHIFKPYDLTESDFNDIKLHSFIVH